MKISMKSIIKLKRVFQRLRLRGDWSDTGPNARPEGNQQANTFNNDGDNAASESQEASDGSQSQPLVRNKHVFNLSRISQYFKL